MSDIGEQVQKITVEHLGVYPDKVTPQANFIDDFGVDSLDVVELVMAIEDEFGVEIPDEDAEKFNTVQDAIRYIKAAKGQGGVRYAQQKGAERKRGKAREG